MWITTISGTMRLWFRREDGNIELVDIWAAEELEDVKIDSSDEGFVGE